MIKYCPRCGSRNVSREPICAACGHKLYGLLSGGVERATCGVCSAVSPATAVFCTGCRRRMDEPIPESLLRPPNELPPLPDLVTPPPVILERGSFPGPSEPRPTVRAAASAVAPPVEMHPRHRAIGCFVGTVVAVVGLVLFGLMVRQTQQALLAETAPTARSGEVAGERSAGAGRTGPADAAVVVGASGPRVPAPTVAAAEGRAASAPAEGSPAARTIPTPGLTVIAGRSSPAAAGTTPARADAAAAPAPATKNARVPVRTGSMVFQLDDLTVEPRLADRTPVPGHRFVVATATIQNVGSTPLPYDGPSTTLLAGDGTTYTALPGVGGGLRAGALPPGERVSGRIVFDTPIRRDLTLRFASLAVDLSASLP